MQDILDCVFITDEGYIIPTITALTSLNENLRSLERCAIHVIAIDLTEASLADLDRVAEHYRNIIVHKVDSGAQFQGLENSSHVSTAALFKFKLPELLADLDKVLYLDGDILIAQDIYESFKGIELGEHYVASVKDINVMKKRKRNPLEKLGAKYNSYFNSGVMLLNLKKMRENGLTEAMVDFKKNQKSAYMDQDAFNFCFGGNAIFLPPAFNYLTFGFNGFSAEELNDFYGVSNFFGTRKLHDDVVIYHFASKWKPWNVWLLRYTSMYQKYYRLTPNADRALKLDYSVQIKFLILSVLRFFAPHMFHRALEPSSRRVSIINALLKCVEELIKAIMPNFVHLAVNRLRASRKAARKK